MADLFSNAEKNADKSREISEFANFSLPGVKEKVAILLDMIGKVQGIFSTYTDHSINHVDKMLNSLDWLIPPMTQEIMTSVDWLLIVLAIYFHDLGMVVSSSEFENRMVNKAYKKFLEDIETNSVNKDFLARIERIQGEERDKFLYQEFIRYNHAHRICDLIKGRDVEKWGQETEPIFCEIKSVMQDLPPRFKENLANVCESHHLENLNNKDYFPILQRYSGHKESSANVQYAALLLRTADLLHVTKDRTPSIMYKTIGLSDPKGIDEWKKQMGIFSVNRLRREFDPDDSEGHIIEFNADFSEERPFFALTEYISYVRKQIEQTKNWADVSQRDADAKLYWFPWHTIKSNILVEGHEPVPMKFELDRGRLLDLLVGHTIYNDATVAVRELIQNAIDAVRYQHYLDKLEISPTRKKLKPMGKVTLSWDENERELIVEDTGTGMDREIISSHLMRVGASFYNTAQFHQDHKDFSPISRFGIGILTNFMISDDIEIVTVKNGEGFRIRLTSVHSDYLLNKVSPNDPLISSISPHGSRVRIKVRASVNLQEKTMLDIIKHWIVLPECDVFFKEPGKEQFNIGFKTVNDALNYYSRELIGNSQSNTISYEIRNDETVFENAEYKIAYLVTKGFTPEWNFVTRQKSNMPQVCVEGIRVDSSLPGMDGESHRIRRDREIRGILSVRGNKNFRTSVSRTNLEKDQEYFKVARLCIKFFIDHLHNEVKRISTDKGEPLSRASTAGNWIYKILLHFTNPELRDFIAKLYEDVPVIVIEKMDTRKKPFNVTRELISLKELKGIEEFWTIESRLVNYLGTISRDLGKELSLNEFLSNLAPEFQDSRIEILIPEAFELIYTIIFHFTIVEVEFSLDKQQTLIHWEREDRNIISELKELRNNREFESEYILRFPLEKLYSKSLSRGIDEISCEYLVAHFLRVCPMIFTSRIIGDIKGIRGIGCDNLSILDENSDIGQLWLFVKRKIIEISNTSFDSETLGWLLICGTFIANCILDERFLIMSTPSNSLFLRSEEREFARSLKQTWRDIVIDMPDLLKNDQDQVSMFINLDLEDLLGSRENWFDASDYWWDWSNNRTVDG